MSNSANGVAKELTTNLLDSWATDPKGPVALHLKQRLLPVEAVEGEEQIIYPPTYADVGYNIDRLADGTCVALIDSVGSQANRLEPAFKRDSGYNLGELVPQIDIVLRTEPCGKCGPCKKAKDKAKSDKCEQPWQEKRSLFDLAHRAADAVVQSSPTLLPEVERAFAELRKTGNAGPLCTIAPTSLVFGCWDSRGGSGEKLPRLVRSIIRAWDVEELHAAAQFNSIWKQLDEEQQTGLEKAMPKGKKLSEKGFKDAPAVFRKDGSGKRRVLGGILVRERIQRDVTINLVALRGLRGNDETESNALRKYLLGLSLMAATVDIDLFLREGCNLRFGDTVDQWNEVPRRGDIQPVDLVSANAQTTLFKYSESSYLHFQSKWAEKELGAEHKFDLSAAKKLLTKKTEEENGDD